VEFVTSPADATRRSSDASNLDDKDLGDIVNEMIHELETSFVEDEPDLTLTNWQPICS